ncbi:MAG: hypothetical protein KGZ58_12745 [Ignavibacteriales bacterium]|nr:hypothetical protein [Ignavibacteriales bacterium]
MQTHENLIDTAIREGWVNALAFYYSAKKKHSNSCYYGLNISNVSRETGVSFKTAKKFLKTLYEKGLVIHQPGNFVFVSQKESRKLYGYKRNDNHLCTIKITKDTSLKEIRQILYSKIIELKARQQLYKAKQPDNRLTTQNKRETAKQIVNFSDATLSHYLGISKGTVTTLKKYLVKKGVFEIHSQKPKRLFELSAQIFNQTYDVLQRKYGNVFLMFDRNGTSILCQCFNSVYVPMLYGVAK